MVNLPMDTANAILGYLATRPYQEVYQLIAAFQEAAKQSAAPKEAPTEAE
jgi:hypothetical protein